jgi:hypothetical protein
MPIGELLIERRLLPASELTRLLDEQQRNRQRIISLVIEHGLLDFDTAARALGEFRGFPALLEKHIAARDPRLAALVPAESGRTWCALPIGRTSSGALIVAARDPNAQLQAALAQATRLPVTIGIVPATRIEALVAQVYGAAPAGEFDVDVESRRDLAPAPLPSRASPPLPDMDVLDPDSVRLALADLDDARVTKDAAASGPFTAVARTSTLPPAPPSLETTRLAIERAATRDLATDAALAFLSGGWVAALIVAVRTDLAIGYRGHGSAIGAVDQIAIPLDSASTLGNALETKLTSLRLYDGAAQSELARRLGSSSLAAAPILVGGRAIAAIVVGDPIQGLGETDRSIADLGRLAHLLGVAWERIVGDRH